MTIEELVKSYGVTLSCFDNELWPRPGIYIDEINVIFINKLLSDEAMKKSFTMNLDILTTIQINTKDVMNNLSYRLIGT